MNFSLEGKVALITGGSHGIGRAAALRFARAGADVIVASRKLPDLEKIAEEIRKLGRKSLAISTHVGKVEEINNLVSKAKGEFGRIDILVNNAGTSPAMVSALDIEERFWDSVMNLNLKGLFFVGQAVARVMKEHGGGRIINVASVGGLRPFPNESVYDISKAGVIMATKVMAIEWAQYGIRVNTVIPGYAHTRLTDSMFRILPEVEKELIRRAALRRIADPDEIVGAMIYFASDASSFTTGATLLVDGGLMLG